MNENRAAWETVQSLFILESGEQKCHHNLQVEKIESDMPNLVALSEEFCLVRKLVQVVLENLVEIEDIRVGSTARKFIPLLMDLLRPIPDRSSAPPIAAQLLTGITDGSDTNKLIMAEAGALDALTKYLSLSPQDFSEATVSELLRILFSNLDLPR